MDNLEKRIESLEQVWMDLQSDITQLTNELESVQRERDKWFDMLNDLSNFTASDHQSGETVVQTVKRQVESLRSDKAALIEVLEWYGAEFPYESAPIEDGIGYEQPEVMNDKGERARTILDRMKE